MKIRVSGFATYLADTVFFVKRCAEPSASSASGASGATGPACDDKLIASNYAREGRVYLLNAEPGEYRPVVASFEMKAIGNSSLYFTYLPQAMVREATAQVEQGKLTSAGDYAVAANFGICPETAEPEQLKYADIIEPGTAKCGLFKTILQKLSKGDFIFIGGKAYATGQQTFHYRGASYERHRTPDETAHFLEQARTDLTGSGWERLTPSKP